LCHTPQPRADYCFGTRDLEVFGDADEQRGSVVTMQAKIQELLTTGKYAVLTTMMPNGAPSSHMMWAGCDDDGNVLINTEIHRRKFKNMGVGSKATILVFENNFSWAEVRGTVVGHVAGQAARDHIDALAQVYTGAPYANPIQSERVIVQIKPDYEFVFPPSA
jgi:hypothetical protein